MDGLFHGKQPYFLMDDLGGPPPLFKKKNIHIRKMWAFLGAFLSGSHLLLNLFGATSKSKNQMR